MSVDLSIAHLIANASVVVQLVMLTLVAASVASWTIILRKRRALARATAGADAFEERFWSGGNLAEIFAQGGRADEEGAGMERIFRAGFKEFSRMRKQGTSPQFVVEATQRAMRVATSREMDEIEGQLPFLATVGSTSPYVGLFGTVWGIMNSFRALGQVQQATLAAVAPGIAEALIATAIGLFAAIPAVVAYNRFAAQAERLGNRYEIFAEEFTAILQRNAHSGPVSGERSVG
jgi:biopolymer transport protein TolQ